MVKATLPFVLFSPAVHLPVVPITTERDPVLHCGYFSPLLVQRLAYFFPFFLPPPCCCFSFSTSKDSGPQRQYPPPPLGRFPCFHLNHFKSHSSPSGSPSPPIFLCQPCSPPPRKPFSFFGIPLIFSSFSSTLTFRAVCFFLFFVLIPDLN